MNVTDQWMLERMQQMAANMAASLPQVGQSTDTSKPEKGDSFKDLMDKAKDNKVEAPEKDSAWGTESCLVRKTSLPPGTFRRFLWMSGWWNPHRS